MFILKVLHYVSILQGEAFEIDPTNGQISLKKKLDFESSNKIYFLNVTATVSWNETFWYAKREWGERINNICNNNYYILNKMWEKVFNIQHL